MIIFRRIETCDPTIYSQFPPKSRKEIRESEEFRQQFKKALDRAHLPELDGFEKDVIDQTQILFDRDHRGFTLCQLICGYTIAWGVMKLNPVDIDEPIHGCKLALRRACKMLFKYIRTEAERRKKTEAMNTRKDPSKEVQPQAVETTLKTIPPRPDDVNFASTLRAAATRKTRKKPGPKPGSRRKKRRGRKKA